MRTLRDVREATGLTEHHLAALVAVATGTLAAWERGHGRPTTRQVGQLALALGVTPDGFSVGTQCRRFAAAAPAAYATARRTTAVWRASMNTARSPAPPVTSSLQDGHLLVEDDAATLELLRDCLGEAGFRVTAATTIEAALVAQRFDLVLSDASASLAPAIAVRGPR